MTSSSDVIGHVAELWRFPVKSMRGERMDRLRALPGGIEQDRTHALLSSGAPIGKPRVTSRERAALLRFQAFTQDGVRVRVPGGGVFAVDDPALLQAIETALPHGNRLTIESDPSEVPYTDVRPVSLVSTQALAALQQSFGEPLDAGRFRSNILLTFHDDFLAADGALPSPFPENALQGPAIRIGDTCVLRLLERIPRCRMVTLDVATGTPNPAVMKHLDRFYGGCFGRYAAVSTPGELKQGDAVRLLP